MSSQRSHHPWPPPSPPPGLSVWGSVLGHLQADGPNHHRTELDHFVPHVIVRGGGTIASRHARGRLTAGDLFCLWPGMACTYQAEEAPYWDFIWLHLAGPGSREFVEACGFHPKRLWLRPRRPDQAIAIAGELRELYQQPAAEHVPEIGRLLLKLVTVCGDGAQPARGERDLVGEALALLRTSLHTGLNVNELCASLDVDRTTLERAFRRGCGESPIRALNRLRLSRAAQLLRGSDCSTDEVAAMVGYGSGKYLMRRLRQDLGVTAGELRRT